jgi:hypothetical protein
MRRSTFISWALCVALASGARASDPIGVYALIDRVVLEPSDASPDRIQIWGAFALAGKPGTGDSYDIPLRGYMYFALQAGLEKVSRIEWNDLKGLAGTGQCVGFGSRYDEKGRIRSSLEEPTAPDPYVVNFGLVKASCDSDFAPLANLASLPVPIAPLDGSRFNEPGPVALTVRRIQAAAHQKALYVFEIEDRTGHLEQSPQVDSPTKEVAWTPRIPARAGEAYTWRTHAVEGDWQGPTSEATFQLHFLRGDVNEDRVADLSDAVSLLEFLFLDGPAPRPSEAGDTNADGVADISDSVFLLFYLYVGGPAPSAPFPIPGLLPPGE